MHSFLPIRYVLVFETAAEAKARTLQKYMKNQEDMLTVETNLLASIENLEEAIASNIEGQALDLTRRLSIKMTHLYSCLR